MLGHAFAAHNFEILRRMSCSWRRLGRLIVPGIRLRGVDSPNAGFPTRRGEGTYSQILLLMSVLVENVEVRDTLFVSVQTRLSQ